LIESFCKEKLSSNMDDEEFHHAVELCKAEVAKWYTDVLQEKLTNLKDLCPANWITLKEHLDKDDAGCMIDTKRAHDHFLHHWLVSLGFQKIVTDFASFDLNQQEASVVGVKQRLEHHEAKEVGQPSGQVISSWTSCTTSGVKTTPSSSAALSLPRTSITS
jgi:hypothetical protein